MTGQELPLARSPRPQPARAITHAVEITGPLNSPAGSALFGKKLFRQRSFKTSHLASPLSSHFSSMPFRRSADMPNRPQTSDAPVVPRRSPARSRDSFNRAKIHVRRPPKGITHWFDALDEDSSDGDYPEVVEPPASAPPGITTFQPSLGPHRARAAPTSFVSQSSDLAADYFSYSHHVRSGRRRKNSAVENDAAHHMRYLREDMNGRSILDLSSDDENALPRSPGWDMMTPSPGPHNPTFLRRATMQRKGSATPFTPTGLRQSMANSRGPRSPTIRQSGRSQPSTASAFSNSNTLSTPSDINYVAVTHEEMALLEMMRRKRAAQADGHQLVESPPTTFQDAITEEDEMAVPMPSPLNPNRQSKSANTDDASRSQSLASTVTLESGENITFPTPPLPSNSPLLNEKPARGRGRSVPLNLGNLPTPPPTASYWSPEIPTPFEEIAELEAVPYTGPLPIRISSNTIFSDTSKRTSRYSLLRPCVFGGVESRLSTSEDFESALSLSIPPRDFGPRDTVSRKPVANPLRSPRRTRTYDPADALKIGSGFNLDFSELQFSPVPNLLSPSLGGLLTSTTPSADWPSSCSPEMRSASLTARSPSCGSHSPSLTDGASLSGRSRSELETPTKETTTHPSIVCDETAGGLMLERLTGTRMTVMADVDGEEHETLGSGRYAVEIRKLASNEETADGDMGQRPMDGDGLRKASTEVMDAWNALGGYPIH